LITCKVKEFYHHLRNLSIKCLPGEIWNL